MHIHLIHPHSTASMTAQAPEDTLPIKNADTRITASNPAKARGGIAGGALPGA